MNKETTIKYLTKIKHISISLFFIHFITILFVILYPLLFTVLLATSTNVDPNHEAFNWTWISSIIFTLASIALGVISIALSIANIVYSCTVKIDNELSVPLIVFSALGIALLSISPLVLWILSVKYINKIENAKPDIKEEEEA